MRTSHTLAALALAALAPAAGCYDPGDLGPMPYKCTADYPDCPDGYTCSQSQHFCVKGTGSARLALKIPKSGVYTGAHESVIDPNKCPSDFKPNDSYDNAKPLGTGTLTGLAICPQADVNVWRTQAQAQFVRVTLTYAVKNGDIDVALLDDTGKIRGTEFDGTARDNACVSSGATRRSGDVWIGVAGANNTDFGPYAIKVDLADTPLSCPTQ